MHRDEYGLDIDIITLHLYRNLSLATLFLISGIVTHGRVPVYCLAYKWFSSSIHISILFQTHNYCL